MMSIKGIWKSQAKVVFIALSFSFVGCGGSGTGSNTPAPVPAPENNNGTFSFSFARNNNTESFGVIGYLHSSTVVTQTYLKNAFSQYEDLQDGECQAFSEAQSFDLETVPTLLDAGEGLNLDTPGGSLSMTRIEYEGDVYYQASKTGNDHFSSKGLYTLTSTGNEPIAAFDASIQAPEDLTVTEPDLTAATVINRNEDLTIAWTSTGSNTPIYATITQKDLDQSTLKATLCKFTDDGEGTITTDTLGEFNQTIIGVYDNIKVWKTSTATFTIPELQESVVSIFESSWVAAVTLNNTGMP